MAATLFLCECVAIASAAGARVFREVSLAYSRAATQARVVALRLLDAIRNKPESWTARHSSRPP
jgi:hypothetical protein